MAENKLVYCYNYGCGQQYSEQTDDNNDQACCYHSGEPRFHDAYKQWTCCGKKSTDFTEFLSFKGCCVGKHSNVKKEPAKKDNNIVDVINERENNGVKQKNQQKFQFDEKDVKQLQLIESKGVQNMDKELNENEKNAPKVQLFCKRCKKSEDKCSPNEECVYHCGQVIFHDSLKYWTCCDKKKFSDFSDFEELRGCQTASEHEMEARVPKPRVDWFQTPTTITIVLYGLKGVRIGKGTKVTTNGRNLWAKLCDRNGVQLYENEWTLKDFVLAEKSSVTIDKSKVELSLEKFSKNNWNSLT